MELLRQESNNFFELQQSALLHQQYIRIMVRNLRPILSDIIRQGNREGSMHCKSPEEVSEIVLIILTIKLDNHLTRDSREHTRKTLDVFSYMLETSFHIEKGLNLPDLRAGIRFFGTKNAAGFCSRLHALILLLL